MGGIRGEPIRLDPCTIVVNLRWSRKNVSNAVKSENYEGNFFFFTDSFQKFQSDKTWNVNVS